MSECRQNDHQATFWVDPRHKRLMSFIQQTLLRNNAKKHTTADNIDSIIQLIHWYGSQDYFLHCPLLFYNTTCVRVYISMRLSNYIIIIYNRKAKSRKIHFTQCSCYLRLFISTKSWINISFCDSRFGDLLKQEIKNKKTKIQKLRKIMNEFQAIIHLNAINSYFPKKNRYFFITLIIFDFCFRKTIDRNERISNIEYKNRPPKMFRNVKTMFF